MSQTTPHTLDAAFTSRFADQTQPKRQSNVTFLRLVTHPRVTENPLTAADAWNYVADWLAVPVVWIPPATESTARVYHGLCAEVEITAG